MSAFPPTRTQSTVPPKDVLPFDARQPATIRLYPLSNYRFGTKEAQPEEDASVQGRLKRLEEHYEKYGMRRTCEGVLVCHEHNQPQVLMLQIANAFFKLPGDYLRSTDPEIDGFKSIMNARLAPPPNSSMERPGDNDWEIADTLAQWYRPHFETNMYPYLPPHITRPKECKKLYLIQLPENRTLSVPKNMKLLAVPLFELYDNSARYGPQLSALPHYLSRFRWEMVNEEGEVEVWTPGGQVDGEVKAKILAGGKGLENGHGRSTSVVKTEPVIKTEPVVKNEVDVKMEDEQQAENGS